jgi:hypothetical protein
MNKNFFLFFFFFLLGANTIPRGLEFYLKPLRNLSRPFEQKKAIVLSLFKIRFFSRARFLFFSSPGASFLD